MIIPYIIELEKLVPFFPEDKQDELKKLIESKNISGLELFFMDHYPEGDPLPAYNEIVTLGVHDESDTLKPDIIYVSFDPEDLHMPPVLNCYGEFMRDNGILPEKHILFQRW